MCKTAIALVLTVITVMLCCTGCLGGDDFQVSDNISEDAPIREITYFSKDVNISEPGSFLTMFSKMDVAVYGNAEYAFGTDIPEDIRNECISATHRLLGYLDVYTDMKIFVLSEKEDKKRFTENGAVYITGLQNFESVDYIASVLPAIFGKYCNYGLVYGYASFLCEELFGTKSKTKTPVLKKIGSITILIFSALTASSFLRRIRRLQRIFLAILLRIT